MYYTVLDSQSALGVPCLSPIKCWKLVKTVEFKWAHSGMIKSVCDCMKDVNEESRNTGH